MVMAAPTTTSLDPVAVAIAIAGALFSPALAQVIGPYAVIVLAAILGAAVSAGLRPPEAKMGSVLHIVVWVGISLLLTVPASMLMAAKLPTEIEVRWLFGPVAALIAGIGHRWPEVLSWGWGLARGLIERSFNRGQGDKQ